MQDCKGCGKIFEKMTSLNTHKRFCEQWRLLDLHVHKNHLSLEDRKKTPASCPICHKEFNNVYSMSAHKGHCGKNRNLSHLNGKRGWSRGKCWFHDKRIHSKFNHDEVFCINSKVSTGYVKGILQHEGLGMNCEICLITEWCEKPIVFELDHINGDRRDNRRDNLRFLCANCHSQTPTWRGRNKGKQHKKTVSDEQLLEALHMFDSIRQALLHVGYPTCGAHYERAKNLLSLSDGTVDIAPLKGVVRKGVGVQIPSRVPKQQKAHNEADITLRQIKKDFNENFKKSVLECYENGTIDFSKFGWVEKLTEYLNGTSSQVIGRRVKKLLPEFYVKHCFNRTYNFYKNGIATTSEK